jgi:hypothetical protein
MMGVKLVMFKSAEVTSGRAFKFTLFYSCSNGTSGNFLLSIFDAFFVADHLMG